jgi:hypothetical protein
LGLSRWEQTALAAFFAAIVVLGGVALWRSAFLPRRMGDWNVFARAAWAIRVGGDIYDVTDDNGFHYVYPPLFAILLTPLADAPFGVDRPRMLPYPLTVAFWYVLSVAFAAAAMHLLANALEQTSPNPAIRSRSPGDPRWWRLRVWPLAACLPAIGHTLIRGQVGLLLLLLICGMLAALLKGRRWQAGCWLAAAICLKVIPIFLLAYPIWRRDLRCLTACFAGLALGLVLVPSAVRGPLQTWQDLRKWHEVVLLPAAGLGQDQSRARELIDATATDSQSIVAALHNTAFLDRATRPRQSPEWVRRAALCLVCLLTFATLAAARAADPRDGAATVLIVGALVLVMLAASPVCHLHYFCLAAPLLMGLFASAWEGSISPRLSKGLAALLAFNILGLALPHFPGMECLRDLGLAMYASLSLWFAGCVALRRRGPLQPRFGKLFRTYPPAIAPTTCNGSVPLATAAGSGASGDWLDRSSRQA